MKNHPSPRTPRDPDHVNLDDDHEVRYWSQTFGCTKEQLEEAVKKVGPRFQAVRAQLGRKVPLSLTASTRQLPLRSGFHTNA